jgi:hypothetical protein
VKHRTLYLLTLACAASAGQSSPFYEGAWKIESAAVAPWWTGKAAPYAASVKTLVGKSLTISSKSIAGPAPLACVSPKYAVVGDYPAEGLFQGNFGEMKRRDPSVDPAALAASVGFRGAARWRTLETGCDGAIDFHFVDDGVAKFAYDNYIYTIRRKPR